MSARGSAISLAVLLLAATFVLTVSNAAAASGSSAPVTISGDADLAAQAASNGWPGDGTSSSPYTISGLAIDNPASGLGIFVSGTTKHILVQDCTISGTTSYAIDITGASNVTVQRSSISGCFCGVMVYSSSGCIVANNTLTGCKTGIQLMSSDHNKVAGNTIAGTEVNAIEVLSSENNTISSNTVTGSGGYGLAFYTSSGNTVYSNTFTANNGAGARYSTDHAQAYDVGTNAWSLNGVSNSWSDWSSSDPYPYEGSAAADAILNSPSLDSILPIIAVVAVVVVVVAAVVLVVKRKGPKAQKAAPQPPAQNNAPAHQAPPVQAPRPAPRMKPWVPAVVGVAVFAVVMVVVASTMGWLPIGSGKLSGARDIGGEWQGTGTFWNYNIFGEKGMLIQATFHMKITLNGNHVTGVLDIYPTSQTKVTDDIAVQEPENHLSIDGNYEVTTLTFETYDTAFEFNFLTDMATGKMTNTDDNNFLGLGSEAGAIHLQRA